VPFIKQQIQLVNQHLLTGCLADARFQSGRIEAIAVDVSRVNTNGGIETFPAVMDTNYEAREIVTDDTYPIILYHKLLGKSYSTAATGNFGDGNKTFIEKLEVKLVVYGKYAALKLTTEQLESLITTGFPDAIAKQAIAPFKLDSMSVTLTGSNLNAAQVFMEEYKGFDLFLAPEDILFSIRYSIESRFRKNCFTICDCNPV
jgi:hypothetical protein